MRWLWRALLAITFIVVFLLAALLFLDNSTQVSLRFLDWQTPELSLYWWLLGALAIGILLGWSLAALARMRARLTERVAHRRTRREVEAAQGEAQSLERAHP